MLQVLQHAAAGAAGLRRGDGGGGADRPGGPAGPRHGDLPPAGPEQALRRRLRRRRLQQPVQLEEHASVQRAAGLQGPGPHPPVRQEEVRGPGGGGGPGRAVDDSRRSAAALDGDRVIITNLCYSYLG